MMLCDWQLFWHEHRQRPTLEVGEFISPDGRIVSLIDLSKNISGFAKAFAVFAEALHRLGRAAYAAGLHDGPTGIDEWPETLDD